MFSSAVLLPCKSKPKNEGKSIVIMTSQEMTSETEIVKRCQREQFYQLVKNEPNKYLYLSEKWPDCHDYVSREFSFLVERMSNDSAKDLVKVEISVKGEHPVVFTSEEGESELANDVSLYVTAKLSERSVTEMGRRLPKRNVDGNITGSDNANILLKSSKMRKVQVGESIICIDNKDIIERLDRIEMMLTQLVRM